MPLPSVSCPITFGGTEIVGNGADEDSLRRAGIEHADAFVSTTRGDNRNVMAAQMAKHIFNVPRVISLIHDPIREEMYSSLGLRTVSPTRIVANSLKEALLAEEDYPTRRKRGPTRRLKRPAEGQGVACTS